MPPAASQETVRLFVHWADGVTVALYFILIVIVGVWTARHVKTVHDFVMPRRFGKVFMVMFSFGTGTQAGDAVTTSAKTYSNGISGIWYQWLWLFCSPFYWLIAAFMRRLRATTTADVFSARYNGSVASLYAFVGLMFQTVNIGTTIKAAAAVVAASTGAWISEGVAIALLTVLFLVYGLAGGLAAAIVTDFFQGILTIVFSFMLLPFLLAAVGGMSGLHQAISDPAMFELISSKPGVEQIGFFYVLVLSINALVGIVVYPHTMGNCGAGRTEMDGRVGFMGGLLLKRFCTIPWCLIGLCALAYYALPGHESQAAILGRNADGIFGMVAQDFLPKVMPGLLGLFIAAALASVQSSCDAFMVSASGLFTENIYRPLVRGKSAKHYVLVARLAAFFVVVGGLAFAYLTPSVVKAVEIFWKVGAMMGVALWLGLFWRRMTSAGAWASTLAAFGVWWLSTRAPILEFLHGQSWNEAMGLVGMGTKGLEMSVPWQMLSYLTAGAVAGIVASLLTKPVSDAKLDYFYALLRTPVQPGEKLGEPCTIPEGLKPTRRKLFPNSKNIEIHVPSVTSVVGFVIGWICVIALICAFKMIV